MIKRRDFILAGICACNTTQAIATTRIIKKIPSYNGPPITQLLVDKTKRKIFLLSGDSAIKTFKMDLGFAPKGHKTHKGDGRTPEGLYYITHQNPNSKYFLSLKISYPNARDIAQAKALGKDPGGDIFIHGGPRKHYKNEKGRDWTAGCISLSDKNMAWVYAMVKVGTPIYIKP